MADRRDRRAPQKSILPETLETSPPDDALGTALWLLARGLWPLAVSPPGDPRWPNAGKSPIGNGWGIKRPTAFGLRRVFASHPGAGVALMLGPAGGVIDLEGDDPAAADRAMARLFPRGIPETMGWRSTRGAHRLFAWDDRFCGSSGTAVVMLADGALELRLGGRGKQLASICPPSAATCGTRRVWNGCWRIATIPPELARAVWEQQTRRDGGGMKGNARTRRRPDRSLEGRTRYGDAALFRETDLVRRAEVGCRNRTLNRSAFCLGQLVAAGTLDRPEVEAALLDAATDCGLAPKEAEATIRSGLEAGLERPRASRG